jgi:hypothetical protein
MQRDAWDWFLMASAVVAAVTGVVAVVAAFIALHRAKPVVEIEPCIMTTDDPVGVRFAWRVKVIGTAAWRSRLWGPEFTFRPHGRGEATVLSPRFVGRPFPGHSTGTHTHMLSYLVDPPGPGTVEAVLRFRLAGMRQVKRRDTFDV